VPVVASAGTVVVISDGDTTVNAADVALNVPLESRGSYSGVWYNSWMPKSLSAEDIFSLVDCLSPQERIRLLRLISTHAAADDRDCYNALPPRNNEFSTDEEPLAWEAEGWENFS
jgi:hypothetical protein